MPAPAIKPSIESVVGLRTLGSLHLATGGYDSLSLPMGESTGCSFDARQASYDSRGSDTDSTQRLTPNRMWGAGSAGSSLHLEIPDDPRAPHPAHTRVTASAPRISDTP